MRILLAILCVAWMARTAQAQGPARPNIVLVMADDLGWGDVGYQGHPRLRTPNLDAMAAAGVQFARFYAAAPVCSPTRGSCLTGRHPSRYGIRGANSGHLPEGEDNLAELLRAQGYRTGHFGKWHLGTLTKTVKESNRGGPRGVAHYAPPWDRGFDVCFSTEAKVPTWNPMEKPGKPGEPYGTHYWTGPEQRVTDGLDGDDSRVIVDRVVPFVQQAAKDGAPFFAVVWFHAPHKPVLAGPEDLEPYRDVEDAEAQRYYACVSVLDEQVGRIRATLRDAGVAEDTVLWFCSDNGPENRRKPGSAGPLRGRKRDLYEGGVRVPGLLEWPKRFEPRVVEAPVSTSDFLPTVLAWLGITRPDLRPLDGIDVTSLITGAQRKRRRPIAFHSGGRLALIEQRWKLVRPKRDAEFELYDLLADPAESKDLAGSEPDRVRRMRSDLGIWQKACAKSAKGFDYEQPLPGTGDYFTLRGDAPLERSRAKFERGTGRVAFLGGSITYNRGWRDLVCGELQRRFPGTEFDFVAAGIPSFGSTPNAFRLARDVLARGSIDLLFVESAVNDSTNGRSAVEQVRAMEGVMRHARRHSPHVDVVMLHFVDPDKMRTIRGGETPDVIRNHERVAAHYGVTSIDLAREVTERIDAGQFTWKQDFRNLHPSPFGQGIYARSIYRLFDAAWKENRGSTAVRTTPEPLDARCYDDGVLVAPRDATVDAGWSLDPNWRPASGASGRSGFVGVPVLVGTEPGATLRLDFDGRAVGILANAGPDAGVVEYRVDDGAWRRADLFTRWSARLHLPWTTMLDAELERGSHTLELRIAADKNERSTGNAVRIVHFVVNR